MSLKKRIEQALKDAVLAKEELRRNAIRMLLSAIKNKEKDVRRELDDSEVQQVIARAIKQRRESAEQYRKGSREDLAVKEEREIEILEEFLPPQLPFEELEAIIEAAIVEVGASSPKDLGKVMKLVMPKVTGRADGKQVNELVRQKLSNQCSS